MRRIRSLCRCCGSLCRIGGAGLFLIGAVPAGAKDSERVVSAYVPSWGMDSLGEAAPLAENLTHVIYAFAKPEWSADSGPVVLSLDFEGNGLGNADALSVFDEFLAMGGESSGLRRLVAVGGWGLSEDFSDIASTRKGRRQFAQALTTLVLENGLDGVDIDWEYPVSGGASNHVHRPEDRENFVRLCAEIRRTWQGKTAPSGDPLLLTIAVPGSFQALSTRYDLAQLAEWVDWFHVMAYDYAGSWSQKTGHFAPLFAEGSPLHRQHSAAGAVAALQQLGVEREKIVLGLGLAGIRFEEVFPRDGQWIDVGFVSMDERGRSRGWNDFRNLVPMVQYPREGAAQWQLRWDDSAKASYWISPETQELISAESLRSTVRKAQFVRDEGLRGMMFWSLEKDSVDLQLIAAGSRILGVGLSPGEAGSEVLTKSEEEPPVANEPEEEVVERVSFEDLLQELGGLGRSAEQQDKTAGVVGEPQVEESDLQTPEVEEPFEESSETASPQPAYRTNWRAR